MVAKTEKEAMRPFIGALIDLVRRAWFAVIAAWVLKAWADQARKAWDYRQWAKIMEPFYDREIEKLPADLKLGLTKAESYTRALRETNISALRTMTGIEMLSSDAGRLAREVWSAAQWSIGIGWLSWVALSPAFSVAIAEPARQAWNYMIKPRIISAAHAIDLKRMGYLSEEKLREILYRHGYNDEQIRYLLKREEKLLSKSELAFLFRYGILTHQDVYWGLRRLGYSEKDAYLVYLEICIRAKVEPKSLDMLLRLKHETVWVKEDMATEL